LQQSGIEERQLVERRQHLARHVLSIDRVRALDPAVLFERDVVATREVVVAHGRQNRRLRNRPIEPHRRGPLQLDVVHERDRHAAVNRRSKILAKLVVQPERDQHPAVARQRCHLNAGTGRQRARRQKEQQQRCADTNPTHHHSLVLSKSFNSDMNSPMSRKCQYTDANRTYATLSRRRSSFMTNAPTSSVLISRSGLSCSADSTRSAMASSAVTLTGRFSHALSSPASNF